MFSTSQNYGYGFNHTQELLVSFFTNAETCGFHFFIFGHTMGHISSNMDRIVGPNFESE